MKIRENTISYEIDVSNPELEALEIPYQLTRFPLLEII